jgi:hypothetical protein
MNIHLKPVLLILGIFLSVASPLNAQSAPPVTKTMALTPAENEGVWTVKLPPLYTATLTVEFALTGDYDGKTYKLLQDSITVDPNVDKTGTVLWQELSGSASNARSVSLTNTSKDDKSVTVKITGKWQVETYTGRGGSGGYVPPVRTGTGQATATLSSEFVLWEISPAQQRANDTDSIDVQATVLDDQGNINKDATLISLVQVNVAPNGVWKIAPLPQDLVMTNGVLQAEVRANVGHQSTGNLQLTFNTDSVSISPILTFVTPINFKTYDRAIAGPDKPHSLNLQTRQNEKTFYGNVNKCVSSELNPAHPSFDILPYVEYGIYDEQSVYQLFKIDAAGDHVDVVEGFEVWSKGNGPVINSHYRFDLSLLLKAGGDVLDSLILTVLPRDTKTEFDVWYANENPPTWTANLPSMFSSITVKPSLLRPDRNMNPKLYNFPTVKDTRMHPNAFFEMRSLPDADDHVHQLCFDKNGLLITSGVSAGSADKSQTPGIGNWSYAHITNDVNPFIWALQLDGNPAEQDFTNLSSPMMHEGAYIRKYLQCRPTFPNTKPVLPDGFAQ